LLGALNNRPPLPRRHVVCDLCRAQRMSGRQEGGTQSIGTQRQQGGKKMETHAPKKKSVRNLRTISLSKNLVAEHEIVAYAYAPGASAPHTHTVPSSPHLDC
jgi:hypothetical protein